MIDVIIDTDAYNEIDDQFAISYLLKNNDTLNTVAIYAAPFLNSKSTSPKDGMEKSYKEIIKLLELSNRKDLISETYLGSEDYLKDENTPQYSAAAMDLAKRAMNYSSSNPLNVVAIGAITNIASAVLIEPKIVDRIRLIWLGGHARHFSDTREFNMRQDYAGARVVMSKVVDFVQLPCIGVVNAFTISKQELEHFLLGKNPLADYLAANAIKEADSYALNTDWTRVIWDVTAVAYLVNGNRGFMYVDDVDVILPGYDGVYENKPINKKMKYVYYINRDKIMNDMINRLLKY